MTPGTVFTTLHFLRNLQMGPIGLSLHYIILEGLPGTNTLAYWVKISVVNITPGTVFTALHFLRNLQMSPISFSVT